MSINRRYITKGVQNEINIQTVMLIWSLVDEVINNNDEYDYLQVFELKSKDDKQIIIHKQEIPEYKKEYELTVKEDFIGKVFVIEDEDDKGKYYTMLLAHEY